MSIAAQHRPTYAKVKKSAIQHNIKQLQKQLKNQAEIFAVLKANAYGHGAVEVAKMATEAGVTGFCVAMLDEALELRAAGFIEPIIILEPIEIQDVPLANENKLSLTVSSLAWLEDLLSFLAKSEYSLSEPIRAHIAYDSGMNRIGFTDLKELATARQLIQSTNDLMIEGLYTHFATADEAQLDYFHQQQEKFKQVLELFAEDDIPYIHTANTATAFFHQAWQSNIVRLGIGLYGLSPTTDPELSLPFPLKQAMSLETKLTHVKKISPGSKVGYGATYTAEKDEWIGTIPIGYADGLRRDLQGFSVLIEGEEAEIVGRICMDQCMIRLSKPHPTGTIVTIFGENNGKFIGIQSLASYMNTINHEVTCLITERVPRYYVE